MAPAPAETARQVNAAVALHEAELEARRLSTLLISIQEDERRRIAFDLHDGLGQSLSVLKLLVDKSARLVSEGATQQAGETLREMSPQVDEALETVRRVAMELRPPMLEDLGILPTLSWFFRQFEAASAGTSLVKAIEVAEHDVPPALHIMVFRIVQEALHNVVKHAAATTVRVRLDQAGGGLRLLIEDDGRGFDPAGSGTRKQSPSLGLLSMRERASVSGGSLHVQSAPGRGTSICVTWPQARSVEMR